MQIIILYKHALGSWYLVGTRVREVPNKQYTYKHDERGHVLWSDDAGAW